jgi:hypothetical protein
MHYIILYAEKIPFKRYFLHFQRTDRWVARSPEPSYGVQDCKYIFGWRVDAIHNSTVNNDYVEYWCCIFDVQQICQSGTKI